MYMLYMYTRLALPALLAELREGQLRPDQEPPEALLELLGCACCCCCYYYMFITIDIIVIINMICFISLCTFFLFLSEALLEVVRLQLGLPREVAAPVLLFCLPSCCCYFNVTL